MHLDSIDIMSAKKVSVLYDKIVVILSKYKTRKMEIAAANLKIAVKFALDAIEDKQ